MAFLYSYITNGINMNKKALNAVLPRIRSVFHAGQRLSLLEHLLLREGTFLLLILPLFVFLLFLVFIHLRDKR